MKTKKNIHVVGAVIVKENKVLCAQRGATTTLPYMWEFPGGKIEKNESPKQALIREIKEEMLCDIEVGEQVDHEIYEYDFGIVHLTTFYCELIQGEPVLTEHASIKWMSPNDLPELDWAPADISAIEKIGKTSKIGGHGNER